MRYYLTALLFAFSATAYAADEADAEKKFFKTTEQTAQGKHAVDTAGQIPQAVQDTIKRIVNNKNTAEIKIVASAAAGLYEVSMGSEVFYVTADAKHILLGDLRDTTTGKNLSEARRGEVRAENLKAVDENDMVVFAPEGKSKYTITVFTDVDCPYCVKLHNEVPALNKAGVKVRYLAYPRAGVGSRSYQKMVSAWCAEDKQDALTKTKNGQSVKESTCDNPVTAQFQLGQKIGIRGTPAILFDDGELLPGYLPANRIISYLVSKSLPALGGATQIR